MQASSGPGLPPDAIDDIHARIVYQAQAVLADSTIDLSIKAMNAPAEPERDREGIEVEVGG